MQRRARRAQHLPRILEPCGIKTTRQFANQLSWSIVIVLCACSLAVAALPTNHEEESLLRFEARELATHAKPVSVDSLKIGVTYFSVAFLDREMRVPILQPLVFIGKNLVEGDVNRVYFQDADSHREGITFEAEEDEAEPVTSKSLTRAAVASAVFYEVAETDAGNIFEYEDALNELLKCSLRRR